MLSTFQGGARSSRDAPPESHFISGGDGPLSPAMSRLKNVRAMPISAVGVSVIAALSHAVAGIDTGFRQLERAAERISREGAGGDLASNLVDLKVSQRSVETNVVIARVADETIGTLLDVLG